MFNQVNATKSCGLTYRTTEGVPLVHDDQISGSDHRSTAVAAFGVKLGDSGPLLNRLRPTGAGGFLLATLLCLTACSATGNNCFQPSEQPTPYNHTSEPPEWWTPLKA